MYSQTRRRKLHINWLTSHHTWTRVLSTKTFAMSSIRRCKTTPKSLSKSTLTQIGRLSTTRPISCKFTRRWQIRSETSFWETNLITRKIQLIQATLKRNLKSVLSSPVGSEKCGKDDGLQTHHVRSIETTKKSSYSSFIGGNQSQDGLKSQRFTGCIGWKSWLLSDKGCEEPRLKIQL